MSANQRRMSDTSLLSSVDTKIACVLVGLPARGKTYIGQKVSRYLRWLGFKTKIFNVGEYRRQNFGAVQPPEFFDHKNQEANQKRHLAAEYALEDMLKWLKKDGGQVAIYDATNSTKERRAMVLKACESQNVEVMFVESICNKQEVIMGNIKDVKLSSPDYKDVNPDQAASEFIMRIKHYEDAYETLEEHEGSYLKMIDVNSEFIINRITGFLQSRIVYYLMNLHISPREIYLTRHGESELNVVQRIGGDSDLSENGKQYALKLSEFLKEMVTDPKGLTVWTSTLKRTIQTGQYLTYPKLQWRALDEIDAGVCDGLTYEEIEERHPEDFAARDDDKFNFRYRSGESYRDLVLRLEPIIMELERQTNILIIGHQAVLRGILAYFLDYPLEELPYLEIPLHTVLRLTPKAYKTVVEKFPIDVKAVSTHRDPRKHVFPAPGTPSSH